MLFKISACSVKCLHKSMEDPLYISTSTQVTSAASIFSFFSPGILMGSGLLLSLYCEP